MSVGCVCVVFVLDVVWFKNVNTSEPLEKEDVTAMTSSSRRERLGDFKSHSYVTLPSCVSLSQPTFICFQWPVTNLSELQQSIQNLSWRPGSTRPNMRRIAITRVFWGLHEEVHCIPSNYKTFLGVCPRRNCPSAHALASHQKLFSWNAIKGVKTIKCYGPWKCLTSRYTRTVPKTTWQQSSNMKCLKRFKICLKVDFDSEKINPAILCAISSCWEVFAMKKENFSQNDGLLLGARMDEAA